MTAPKRLVRAEFLAWLRARDGQPCGDGDRCPVATYLQLPLEGDTLEDGEEAWNPNEVALDLASEAGLEAFIEWADSPLRQRPGMPWGWWFTGDEAADFLESLP